MIGTAYFVIKSTVVTLLIVSLLQFSFRGKTLENRLMQFVRTKIAPQVLGESKSTIDHSKYRLSPKELIELKNKVFESESLKGVQKSVKSLFFKEMTSVMENSKKKQEEEEKD